MFFGSRNSNMKFNCLHHWVLRARVRISFVWKACYTSNYMIFGPRNLNLKLNNPYLCALSAHVPEWACIWRTRAFRRKTSKKHYVYQTICFLGQGIQIWSFRISIFLMKAWLHIKIFVFWCQGILLWSFLCACAPVFSIFVQYKHVKTIETHNLKLKSRNLSHIHIFTRSVLFEYHSGCN